MKKRPAHPPNSRRLPQIAHLEGDVFAARLAAGDLRITSIGAENCYAVDVAGREFYAKDVPPDGRVPA